MIVTTLQVLLVIIVIESLLFLEAVDVMVVLGLVLWVEVNLDCVVEVEST